MWVEGYGVAWEEEANKRAALVPYNVIGLFHHDCVMLPDIDALNHVSVRHYLKRQQIRTNVLLQTSWFVQFLLLWAGFTAVGAISFTFILLSNAMLPAFWMQIVIGGAPQFYSRRPQAG